MRWTKLPRFCRRAIMAVAILAIPAVVFAIDIYDPPDGIRWTGGCKAPLRIESDQRLADLRWKGFWKYEAEWIQSESAKGEYTLAELIAVERPARSIMRGPDKQTPKDGSNGFLLSLKAGGSESGLIWRRSTSSHQSHIGLVGEFEDGTPFAKLVALPPGWVHGQEIVVQLP